MLAERNVPPQPIGRTNDTANNGKLSLGSTQYLRQILPFAETDSVAFVGMKRLFGKDFCESFRTFMPDSIPLNRKLVAVTEPIDSNQ